MVGKATDNAETLDLFEDSWVTLVNGGLDTSKTTWLLYLMWVSACIVLVIVKGACYALGSLYLPDLGTMNGLTCHSFLIVANSRYSSPVIYQLVQSLVCSLVLSEL